MSARPAGFDAQRRARLHGQERSIVNPERRALIAGNWKMNAGGRDARALAAAVAREASAASKVDVIVAPPFTAIAIVAEELDRSESRVWVAAQTMSHEPSGAFTGEVASSMIRDVGATWVILGHSERRQLYGETDAIVAQKTKAAMASGPRPIVCVGETLAEREAGATIEVVSRQVRAVVEELARQPGFGAIAYEPVWAIGTGKVASPEDAGEVHAAIRALLREASIDLARATRVLYGGSVKADNARALLAQPDIDGALVGGASLDAAGFGRIIQAAEELSAR
jgi:triosephosphate isomerase (TIM)